MSKIGIIVDSSCGLSKSEAEKIGLYFAPILITFNGKEMHSGVDIDNEWLYEHMTLDSTIKTAAVPMGTMLDLITKARDENDEVIVITISKHLSSGNDNAKVVAKDFDNVYVYDSEFVTPWIEHILVTLEKLATEGKKNEIFQLLDDQRKIMWAILAPANLEYLYSGGRISKTQYVMGSMLKIFPLLPVINGSVSDNGVIKARTEKKAAAVMVKEMKNEYNRLIKSGFSKEDIEISSIDMNAPDFHQHIKNEMKKNHLISNTKTKITSEIIAHIGPGAAGCGLRLKNKN